jgi:large subunit ribosomal protein L17
MRHQRKEHRLGRGAAHRKATLAALSNALIRHKRITTTLARARALRIFVEPLVTRAKEDSVLNRRQVFRRLQDKASVTELFGEIATRVGDRPGGYTRIVKLGQRAGDASEMALIELVDYNDVKPFGSSDGKKKRTRRGGGATRRRSGVPAAGAAPVAADEVVEAVEETAEVEEAVDTPAVAEEVEAAEPEAEAPAAEPEAEAPAAEPEAEAPAAEPEAEAPAAEPEAEPADGASTAEASAEQSGPEAADETAPEGEESDEDEEEGRKGE